MDTSYSLQMREDEYENGRLSVKNLDPEASAMVVEEKWNKPTKVMITKKENAADI